MTDHVFSNAVYYNDGVKAALGGKNRNDNPEKTAVTNKAWDDGFVFAKQVKTVLDLMKPPATSNEDLTVLLNKRLAERFNGNASELARAIGTSQQNISNWMNGDVVKPSYWMDGLAALGIHPEHFLSLIKPEEEPKTRHDFEFCYRAGAHMAFKGTVKFMPNPTEQQQSWFEQGYTEALKAKILVEFQQGVRAVEYVPESTSVAGYAVVQIGGNVHSVLTDRASLEYLQTLATHVCGKVFEVHLGREVSP